MPTPWAPRTTILASSEDMVGAVCKRRRRRRRRMRVCCVGGRRRARVREGVCFFSRRKLIAAGYQSNGILVIAINKRPKLATRKCPQTAADAVGIKEKLLR